jgi:hypothetical protein
MTGRSGAAGHNFTALRADEELRALAAGKQPPAVNVIAIYLR